MAIDLLPGVPSAGTLSLTFVPVAGFDPEAPSVALATGASAINVSCLIPRGTYTGITTTVNRIAKYRACSDEPYYIKGQKDRALERIQVIYDPQDPAAAISEGYAALVEDSEWFVIDRRGKSGQDELAIGDYVDVMRVTVVARNKPYSEEEGDEAVADILLTFGGSYAEDVQMVA